MMLLEALAPGAPHRSSSASSSHRTCCSKLLTATPLWARFVVYKSLTYLPLVVLGVDGRVILGGDR